ncbi:ABC transporter permease [Paracoccaceae bacterium Fryx2]|nr:ABC transporter permease [Paracoccaceae bacterium Fryx2]
MHDLWADLSPAVQDALLALLLIAPGFLAGALVLRALRPLPLVGAMLRRFVVVNGLFVALITVSVGLGVGLLAQERGLRQGSARAAEKFDLIVAAPGSEVTVMLAAVYLQPSDMPLVTGPQYAEIAGADGVAFAAPIAFGDSHLGAPVVGTTTDFVTHLAGPLAEGRLFSTAGEAVAGAYAPVAVGGSFTPAHGHGPAAEGDAHAGSAYTITGRMAPTGSPWDRAILVPVEGVWAVHGLANGHAPDDPRIGPPFVAELMPGTPAVLVHATEIWGNYALKSRFTRADLMAFFPGTVLAQLHGLMRDVRAAMSLMAVLTQVLVTLSVLIGLMILVRLIARSLALLRAIGAPLRFVFAVVWAYSAALIVTGAGLGLALGWVAARALSAVVTARTDVLVTAHPGWPEVHLVAGFISLTLFMALMPAWLAARRPLLTDLRT